MCCQSIILLRHLHLTEQILNKISLLYELGVLGLKILQIDENERHRK